jgi:hypothetical protein
MAGTGGTGSDRCMGMRDGLGAGDGAVPRGEADARWLGRAGRAAARGRIASLRDQAWRPGGRRPGGTGVRSGPTWWAHLSGCAWVAAWLTARGREMLGPRELLVDDSWSGELSGLAGPRRTMHRPDLVGVVPTRRPAAIEVELTRKSKPRLRAILDLHARWISTGRSGACVYVCGDAAMRELVTSQAALAGLRLEDGGLRIELLETIKQLAIDAADETTARARVAEAAR